MKINLQTIPVIAIGRTDSNKDKKLLEIANSLNLNIQIITAVKRNNNLHGNRFSHQNALKQSISMDSPVLILEDDAAPTDDYYNIIDVPDDADAVWLGTSKYSLPEDWYEYSSRQGRYNDRPIVTKATNTLCRIQNMLTTHAILLISKNYKTEMFNYFKYCLNPINKTDNIYAATMKDFKVYGCRKPMFFQNCDRNREATMFPIENLLP